MRQDPIARVISDANYSGYLVSDEFTEAILALRHLADFLILAKDDRFYWKWAILSAHTALQNSFVAILTHTSGVGALDRNSERKLLERLNQNWNSDRPWPKERLASFPVLATKALPLIGREFPKKPDWRKFDVETDIMRIHLFRNGFSHFKPATWLIETAGLPQIITHCTDAAEEIFSSPKFKRRNQFSDFEWRQDIDKVREILRTCD